jgi:hypothetical protein
MPAGRPRVSRANGRTSRSERPARVWTVTKKGGPRGGGPAFLVRVVLFSESRPSLRSGRISARRSLAAREAYLISMSSTSNIRVAFGGIAPPAPRAP